MLLLITFLGVAGGALSGDEKRIITAAVKGPLTP
jgi:ribosomal protein S28E/S33